MLQKKRQSLKRQNIKTGINIRVYMKIITNVEIHKMIGITIKQNNAELKIQLLHIYLRIPIIKHKEN